MINTALIWALVGLAIAQSGVSQDQALPAPDRLEALRREYRSHQEDLRAEELCGARWSEIGAALSTEVEDLEPDETFTASQRIDGLSTELRAAIIECKQSLHDRYQANLQRLKDHEVFLSAIEGSSIGGLDDLLKRLMKLYRSVDGPPTSGRQLMELESELQEIEHRWAGLDPCERDFRPAMARLGSVSIAQSFEELCHVTQLQCFYPPHAKMARHALERLVPSSDPFETEVETQVAAEMAKDARALLEIPAGRLQSCLPGSDTKLKAILAKFEPESPGPQPLETVRVEPIVAPESRTATIASPEDVGDPESTQEIEVRPEPETPPNHGLLDTTSPYSEVGHPQSPPRPIGFALNVWQSAWDDFSSFEEIIPYLRNNQILEVNLNPGLGMTSESWPKAYSRLKPLVEMLRRAGVETINYLYAELNYPIERYADFLNAYPDLGIDRIVDDSEFTDYFIDRFKQNRERVVNRGVHYSAFITLEGYGNSGVSDESRYWALRNLEQPILMSYFGCTVGEQIDFLRDYLELADGLAREPRYVKVALLLGGKSTGREVSCEQQLDAGAFQNFVAKLDQRLRLYPSYAGIVLETNYRLPRYDLPRSVRPGAR